MYFIANLIARAGNLMSYKTLKNALNKNAFMSMKFKIMHKKALNLFYCCNFEMNNELNNNV